MGPLSQICLEEKMSKLHQPSISWEIFDKLTECYTEVQNGRDEVTKSKSPVFSHIPQNED
jgi:hypothetical protein